MINRLLLRFNNSSLRFLLIPLIYFNYLRKGVKIHKVKYYSKYKVWYYKTGKYAYISPSPGWAYSYDYLLGVLREISCHEYLPKKGDVVLDIGAALGEESIILSDLVGPSGHIHSIEANPKVYSALDFIIRDNALKNVSIYNLAVSDKKGILEIEDSEEDSNSYLSNTIGKSTSGSVFKVNALSVDEFVGEHGIKQIDLLRVNIEGAEQLMIAGMSQSISIIKNAAISCHDFRYNDGESEFFKTKDKVVSYFKENGFEIVMQKSGNRVIDDYVYAFRK